MYEPCILSNTVESAEHRAPKVTASIFADAHGTRELSFGLRRTEHHAYAVFILFSAAPITRFKAI